MKTIHCVVITGFCCLLFAGCAKKDSPSKPGSKTILPGTYSLTGLYKINADGTYTAKTGGSCLENFLIDFKANNRMQLQDACLNISGTWSFANDVLTVTEANGTVDFHGTVEFESDGITIDVNNTIDNTRYQLFRN